MDNPEQKPFHRQPSKMEEQTEIILFKLWCLTQAMDSNLVISLTPLGTHENMPANLLLRDMSWNNNLALLRRKNSLVL